LALAAVERQAIVEPNFEARRVRLPPSEITSPGPEALHMVALEHPMAAADLFWLGVVQEIGAAADGRKPSFLMMRRWADIATDLDPHYFAIYYAVAVNLTVYAKDVEASDTLLAKGWRNLPDAWALPFLMGYNAYFIRGDPEAASKLWLAASQLPDHPRFLLSLASRAQYQAGDALGAMSLLEEMIPFLDGPAKEDAELRLKAFRSEPILFAYDEACRAYRAAHGELPPDAASLHTQGYVNLPPEDLYGASIYLDSDCRARTEYIKVREDEAAQRVGAEGDGADVEVVDPELQP
jgi:hypothetical protein